MGASQSNTAEVLEKLYDKQIKREIALAEHLFEERQALKIARIKELLGWEYLSVGTVAVTALYYGLKTNNKLAIIPTIPFIMATGYHYEQCTNEYHDGVRKTANEILNDPTQKVFVKPIGGPITIKELDERRQRWNKQLS